MKIEWHTYHFREVPLLYDPVLRVPLDGTPPEPLPCDGCGHPTQGRAIKDIAGWVPCCEECARLMRLVEAPRFLGVWTVRPFRDLFPIATLQRWEQEGLISAHPIRKKRMDWRDHEAYLTPEGMRQVLHSAEGLGYLGEVLNLATWERRPLYGDSLE